MSLLSQCNKLIGVLFDEIGEAVQVGAPLVGSHAGPWAFVEGNPRGAHSPGGVLCGSAGDSRPGLLGGRVDRVEPLVGGDPFTVDEVGEFIHIRFCFQLEASRTVILYQQNRWTTRRFRRTWPRLSVDDYRWRGFAGCCPRLPGRSATPKVRTRRASASMGLSGSAAGCATGGRGPVESGRVFECFHLMLRDVAQANNFGVHPGVGVDIVSAGDL